MVRWMNMCIKPCTAGVICIDIVSTKRYYWTLRRLRRTACTCHWPVKAQRVITSWIIFIDRMAENPSLCDPVPVSAFKAAVNIGNRPKTTDMESGLVVLTTHKSRFNPSFRYSRSQLNRPFAATGAGGRIERPRKRGSNRSERNQRSNEIDHKEDLRCGTSLKHLQGSRQQLRFWITARLGIFGIQRGDGEVREGFMTESDGLRATWGMSGQWSISHSSIQMFNVVARAPCTNRIWLETFLYTSSYICLVCSCRRACINALEHFERCACSSNLFVWQAIEMGLAKGEHHRWKVNNKHEEQLEQSRRLCMPKCICM